MRLRPLVLLALLAGAAGAAPGARAQATHAEVLGGLAARCVALPDTLRAVRLAVGGDAAYLRPALLAAWQAEGRTVYVADTTRPAPDAPTLTLAAREARIDLARAGGGRASRTATLALAWTLVAPDGRLLGEALCRDAATDTIDRAVLPALADPAYPATQARLPAGRFRRLVAPVVFTAATAVSVALFFTLRSGD